MVPLARMPCPSAAQPMSAPLLPSCPLRASPEGAHSWTAAEALLYNAELPHSALAPRAVDACFCSRSGTRLQAPVILKRVLHGVQCTWLSCTSAAAVLVQGTPCLHGAPAAGRVGRLITAGAEGFLAPCWRATRARDHWAAAAWDRARGAAAACTTAAVGHALLLPGREGTPRARCFDCLLACRCCASRRRCRRHCRRVRHPQRGLQAERLGLRHLAVEKHGVSLNAHQVCDLCAAARARRGGVGRCGVGAPQQTRAAAGAHGHGSAGCRVWAGAAL